MPTVQAPADNNDSKALAADPFESAMGLAMLNNGLSMVDAVAWINGSKARDSVRSEAWWLGLAQE